MRRFGISGVIVAAMLSSGCSSDSLPARITAGAKFATIVRLPGGSTKQIPEPSYHPEPKFDWNSRMEFRLPKGGDDVLLLRVYAGITDYSNVISSTDGATNHYAETRDYGDHAFALESAGRLRARLASESDWSAAAVVERTDFRLGPHEWEPGGMPLNGAALDDHGAFLYQGKRYPYHTAPGRFIVSPKRRRVAVMSAHVSPNTLGQFFSDAYTYYLDIFDLTSRSLISSAQGSVGTNGLPWISAMEEPSWVTDRYFYMPLSGEHDKLLMFDFGGGS